MNDVKILFEDESICVIDKPYGVIVNNAESVKSVTIQTWFSEKYNIPPGDTEFLQKGGIVHRLDKDTSGVMVLVKNEESYEKLKAQFLERKTVKKYTALVHGGFRDPEGVISQPIIRHPKDRHRFTTEKGGDLSRTAITHWKVIKQYSVPTSSRFASSAQYSLLELVPHTGRTHQLRVHLQYMHHPIVSDPIYGFKKTWKEDLTWCPRLFLHAKYLEFTHPATDERVKFESELPNELEQVVASLVH